MNVKTQEDAERITARLAVAAQDLLDAAEGLEDVLVAVSVGASKETRDLLVSFGLDEHGLTAAFSLKGGEPQRFRAFVLEEEV